MNKNVFEILKDRKEALDCLGYHPTISIEVKALFRKRLLAAVGLEKPVSIIRRKYRVVVSTIKVLAGTHHDVDNDYDGWSALHYRCVGPWAIIVGSSSYYNGIDSGYTQDDMMLCSERREEEDKSILEAMRNGSTWGKNPFLFDNR